MVILQQLQIEFDDLFFNFSRQSAVHLTVILGMEFA